MDKANILKKPKITEKSLKQVKGSVYVFTVEKDANKHQIKKNIETLFKVKVAEVKTMVRKGKIRRVGKRQALKKLSQTKIAFIRLSEGKIDLFPQE